LSDFFPPLFSFSTLSLHGRLIRRPSRWCEGPLHKINKAGGGRREGPSENVAALSLVKIENSGGCPLFLFSSLLGHGQQKDDQPPSQAFVHNFFAFSFFRSPLVEVSKAGGEQCPHKVVLPFLFLPSPGRIKGRILEVVECPLVSLLFFFSHVMTAERGRPSFGPRVFSFCWKRAKLQSASPFSLSRPAGGGKGRRTTNGFSTSVPFPLPPNNHA